jgi:hypothetical protein
MNRLHPIAQAVQSQGRGKDTQLVHMTPGEVQGLQALAKAHGGSLSINPETGLVEAGFLESILPTIAGAGLMMIPGMQPMGAALITGLGATALNGGDLGKGLMAGLGAWGGAGMASSLGIGAAGTAAAQNATSMAGAGATNMASNAANAGMATQGSNLGVSAAQNAATNNFLSQAGMSGVPQASMVPQTTQALSAIPQTTTVMPTVQPTMMDKLGSGQFWKDNWQSAAAAAAPVAMDLLGQKDTIAPKDNEQFQYDYNPGRVSEADLAAQRAANPYGELTYFRPKYGPRQTVQVAQGGEIGYADGGIFGQAANLYKDVMGGAQEYEFDPVTRTYKEKTSASPVGAVAPVGIENSGGSSGTPVQLTKEQIDFFDNEDKSPGGARDQRMGKINDILAMLAPGSIARALVGGANSLTGGGAGQARAPVTNLSTRSPEAVAESESQSVTPDPTGATETYGDTSMGTLFAQGGALRYEDGGPIGAVESVGLRGNRPMDAGYFKDMAADAARNAVISKLGQAVGLSPQVMALGMAGKGIYNFFNPDKPAAPVMTGSDFPSVPGQNPSGDSGSVTADPTGATETYGDVSQGTLFAQGGLAGLAAGGMAKGGFVVPADVVSALGNGSTDAGLRTLQTKLGAIKPIKG